MNSFRAEPLNSHAPQQQHASEPISAAEILVIGAGPVGMRAAQLLAKRGKSVALLSEERHQPYNRVRLTPLLAGDAQFGDIVMGPNAESGDRLTICTECRVLEIDRADRSVRTADGKIWAYETLVIATGSRAFVPNFPGAELDGVYTFRTADDGSALLARSFSARKVAVVGGGLLGLEAARGLAKRHCEVIVVEHENRLMPRQLDEAAAAYLKTKIEALGVTVLTRTRVSRITGDRRASELILGDGSKVEIDTVIICTGVRAAVELAREARLGYDRGILVNAQMQTADPNVYAIGECAQFGIQVVGLVGPGYAQAEVAASAILGDPARYAPSVPATKLKVIGADVFSIGPVEQLDASYGAKSYVWQSDAGYRRIFVEHGKLVGAIAVGVWDQASRVQEAVQNGAAVYPWMLFRFRKSGALWPDAEVDLADLPAAATICNCTGVTCGQIRGAVAKGAASAEAISTETGAGTVCGTCKPLLEEMVDAGAPPKPVAFSKPLLALSAVATLAALIPVIFGYVPMPTRFDAESLRLLLWRDNIVKQWSGFILLGIMAAAMLIGLRKRIRLMDRLGGYDAWRLFHIGIGLAAVAGFFAHTGFRLGTNWNMVLGAAFILTLIAGAAAGLATGGDHTLRAQGIGTARKPARRLPTWLHIFAIWPLPVLILFHVLTIYAY